MKVLVTGGLGFIGSHTVVELQNEGFEVVAIDNLSNADIKVLNGIEAITGRQPIFEKLDLRDKQAVVAFFKKHDDVSGFTRGCLRARMHHSLCFYQSLGSAHNDFVHNQGDCSVQRRNKL